MGVKERLEKDEARLFFEQDNLDGVFFHVGVGDCALYSSRSPAKDTPNEDAAGIISTGNSGVVLAVADGLGGAPAGRQASSMAITCLVHAVQAALKDDQELRTGVLNGFEAANEEVLALGVGAATTLTVVEVNENSARPYHVGDSFMLVTGQRGKIKMQTIPHSPVGYAVESGLLDEKDAMYHEERHYISNVIGSSEMRIDVGTAFDLAPRDTLVLASDGLSDNLHTPEIVERVRKGSLERATAALAKEARGRMENPAEERPSKPDDLTFLIFRLG